MGQRRTSLHPGSCTRCTERTLVCGFAPLWQANAPHEQEHIISPRYVFLSCLTFAWAAVVHAGSVAITIDDGPDAAWTEKACDLADKYGATLTFFVLGHNIQAHPTVAPRIVARGHEVENHTYNHPALPALLPDLIEWQIRRTSQLIHEQTGQQPVFVRPPYGAFSRRTGRVIASTGHRLAMWTIDPQDWNGKNASQIANHVVSRLRDGSVVLLHQKSVTLKALSAILSGCRKKGLECVSLRELWHVPGTTDGADRLAPLRAMTDDETSVDWNQATKTAVLHRRDLSIRFRVGDRRAVRNGESTKMPAAPALYRGQLYVPDEFIAAALAETMESTERGQRESQDSGRLLVVKADDEAPVEDSPGTETSRPTVVAAAAPPASRAVEPAPRSGITLTLRTDDLDTGPPVRAAVRTEATPFHKHLDAGFQYKRKRDFAAAADEFLAATKCEPASTEAHWALAWTLSELNLSRWARREFDRVAALDPAGPRGKQAARIAARYQAKGRL